MLPSTSSARTGTPNSVEVTVVSGARFVVTPDGTLWAERSSPYTYQFWSRYLAVYARVRLIVRARASDTPPASAKQVTGMGVRAEVVPDFHTPQEFLARIVSTLPALKRGVDASQALHLQTPSVLANVVYLLMDRDKPFAVEVKGDPHDSLAPGAFVHPLRPFYRWTFRALMAHQCAHAWAITYATERALQERYPPARARFATHFSNVILPADAFVTSPRRFDGALRPARLVCVGMMKQLNKGPDLLIAAVAECIRRGHDVRLSFVGDGQLRPTLEAQAVREGVGPHVRFLGLLQHGAEVRAELDRSDIFVMPSRQEGVPRAVLEAMARSLPCIGSTVGGFSEILPPDALVPSEDVSALANRIAGMLVNPEQLNRHASRNLERAHAFREDLLQARRAAFFDAASQMITLRHRSPRTTDR